MSTPTLTPAQATQIVKNGGLVVAGKDVWWHDGIELRDQQNRGNFGREVFLAFTDSHPLYPPAVFALTFPCTLPGPEAESLLKAAPVGMLEWQYRHWGEVWLSSTMPEDTQIDTPYLIEIRLRPGWLESQRAKFARGEFGEDQQPKEPIMSRYLINNKLITFPWTGTGPECKAIWEAMPKGMLEWADELIYVTNYPFISHYDMTGHSSSPYHLRLRSDAPKPGDVVDAERAWGLCLAGWVVQGTTRKVVYFIKDGDLYYSTYDGAPASGIMQGGKRAMTEGPFRLLRHEPWRTATLETGYVWSGQDAAQALRAGMEASRNGDMWLRPSKAHLVDTEGCNNWALRWPAKENAEMDKQDETLTPGQALDALIAGGCEFVGKNKVLWTPDDIDEAIGLCTFVDSAPFRRVPKRPTSKTLTIGEDGNKLEVVVYADRVEADVRGCAIWKIPRSKVEAISKCDGGIGAKFEDVATYSGGPSQSASVHASGVKIHRYTITFTDIRRVLDAMAEMGGGE